MDIINNQIEDILDSKGKYNNFITNEEYSEEYKILASKWKELPMYKDSNIVKKFFKLLHDNQVILLVSGTGSGKTVLVPKYFLKYIITLNLLGKIAITNPKILTTIYNAEYGAKTLDVKLGNEVGYKHRGAKEGSFNKDSRLLYVTDGLILATILSGDTYLKDYIGVIIDEAHERGIQIDLLLRLIKIILLKRPEFKLIIMSATINAETFKNYFNIKELRYGEIEITSKSNLPIEQKWLDTSIKITQNNYLELAVSRCLEIIKSTESGDILIFIPLVKDATLGCELLKSKCPSIIIKETCNKLFCIGVYSKMKDSERELAVSKDLYKKDNILERKIIFATNVAESSITFDGLIYVIDTGLELLNYYDYINNKEVVIITYTSQAQIKQRIGRVGRTQPGIAYHLYSLEKYNKLKLYPEPDINKTDLTLFILSLVKSYRTIKNILFILDDMITVPNFKQVLISIHKLYLINAIKIINDKNKKISKFMNVKTYEEMNKYNGTLTSIGLNILKFRSCNLLTSYAVIISKYMNCVDEIIIIMSIIETVDGKIEKLFNVKRQDRNKFISYMMKYSLENSDHLTILNIYLKLYLEKNYLYLNRKVFEQIKHKITQVTSYLNRINDDSLNAMLTKYNIVSISPYKDKIDNILYTLGLSHKYNIIKKDNNNYTSINFLNNTNAKAKYANITKLSKEKPKYAISYTLADVFGRQEFRCITYIPDKIYKKI